MQTRARREYATRRGWTIALQVSGVNSEAARREAREKLIEAARFAGLDPQRATERPTAIETGRSVVIHEDMAEAAISKDGAAEFSNIRRCFQPALRFRIELSKFLQLSILFFR